MPFAVTYHGRRTDGRYSCVRSFSQAAASYTRHTFGMLIRRRVRAGREPLLCLIVVTLDGEVNQDPDFSVVRFRLHSMARGRFSLALS
jgi:hypothetical protein